MDYKQEQFSKKLHEHLQCPICHKIFKEPMSCTSGHTFCYACIHKWLECNSRCPADNTFLLTCVLVPNLTVKGIIDDLDVYCHPLGIGNAELSPTTKRNRLENTTDDQGGDEQNCSWTGKLHELETHRKTCAFQLVTCPYKDCKQEMIRKDLEKHKETCKYKRVVCKECASLVVECKLQEHLEKDCPNAMIPCPNNCSTDGEVTKIRRSTIKTHASLYCSMALLDCPFAEHGCTQKVLRGEVNDHIKYETAWHMKLLAQQTVELRKELAATKGLIIDQPCNTYTWKIKDFLTKVAKISVGSGYISPTFFLCGCAWNLSLYPRGKDASSRDRVYILLRRHEPIQKSTNKLHALPNNEVRVTYSISVLSKRPGISDVSFSGTKIFPADYNSGWRFMDRRAATSRDYYDFNSFTIKCAIVLAPDQ